jgi:two-component system response regulator NreC
MLVDDHTVVREGLRLLIEPEPDLEVCGEASTLQEALDADCVPDVVLADLVLQEARGTEVLGRLRDRFPGAAILVLSMVDNPTDVNLALAAGASGFILKEAASDEVLDGLRRVGRGEQYLQPALGAELARWAAAPRRVHARVPGDLTRREEEVLRLLALGHTNAEVAQILGVALRTVEAHRGHLLQKLGLRTRAELVRYAAESGVIEVTPS